jgi:hypothetical protein
MGEAKHVDRCLGEEEVVDGVAELSRRGEEAAGRHCRFVLSVDAWGFRRSCGCSWAMKKEKTCSKEVVELAAACTDDESFLAEKGCERVKVKVCKVFTATVLSRIAARRLLTTQHPRCSCALPHPLSGLRIPHRALDLPDTEPPIPSESHSLAANADNRVTLHSPYRGSAEV